MDINLRLIIEINMWVHFYFKLDLCNNFIGSIYRKNYIIRMILNYIVHLNNVDRDGIAF